MLLADCLVLADLVDSAKANEEDNDGENKRHDIPWHFPPAVFKLLRRCHALSLGVCRVGWFGQIKQATKSACVSAGSKWIGTILSFAFGCCNALPAQCFTVIQNLVTFVFLPYEHSDADNEYEEA